MYASATRGASDDRLRSRPLPPTIEIADRPFGRGQDGVGDEFRGVNRGHRLRLDADVRPCLVE